MPKLKLASLGGKPEIFHTLQGEGISMGMPAVFIRSSLCNLHCIWCDTDYTWNWVNTPWKHENDSLAGYQKFEREQHIIEPEFSEIASQIISYRCPNLIITGGEPLIQQTAWCELLCMLREHDPHFRFEVETNGTKIPNEKFASYIDQFNVSPKLSNSGNAPNLRICAESYQYFNAHPNAWYKFVISEESDLSEVYQLIQDHDLSRKQIILMPEGRTNSALNEKREWIANVCRDQGFRFGDRLHIRLWGSKRGV